MADDYGCVLSGERIPASLRLLSRPCRQLHVHGRLPSPRRPAVAIVGSRNASRGGRRSAYEIARGLARAGVVVVSGLARGIDAAAHRGALDGGGATVAFLGCGLDVLYPRECRDLAAEIRGQGALASEYPPGTPPQPFRFVQRNRLIAALARGVLVVEAGARSGALITAGYAADLGRELWAVPGDPRLPGPRGSNRLLRDGAGVVLDAGDVLAALGFAVAGGDGAIDAPPPPPGLAGAEAQVWRSLAEEGTCDLEALSRRTALPAARLLEALSVLQLEGFVRGDGTVYAIVSGTGS